MPGKTAEKICGKKRKNDCLSQIPVLGVSPMARIIPELSPDSLEQESQRLVYAAARDLPEEYSVFYGYRFCDQVTGAVIWQADLIIVHPARGFLVFKIGPGEAGFFNGRWYEFVQGSYQELKKDPLAEARGAAYALARSYQEKTGWSFPLGFDFGLCFPESGKIEGQPPGFVRPASLLLRRDLDNFPSRISQIFTGFRKGQDPAVCTRLVEHILAASFRLYNTLEEQIRSFADRAQVKFTQEQERILEETQLNKRMVFYGAAGTGKTMLAVEKARRLAETGKRTVLTCFNKNLANQFPTDVENLTARHFHGLLERLTGLAPPGGQENDSYFENTLVEAGYDRFSGWSQERKFDALVVDEGQDFRPHWFRCLEAMVKNQGEFYVFADRSQNIFQVDPSGLEALPASRFRLTVNLRNTTSVCQRWITPLSGHDLRLGLKDPGEIHFHSWSSDSQQLRLLGKEVESLLARQIQPRRITILSPNRKEKSCLAGLDTLAGCPLAEVGDPRPGALRFSTIRAFKGLEADVVLLIGVHSDSPVCSRPDLYVGGSRARYILHIFHRNDWKL